MYFYKRILLCPAFYFSKTKAWCDVEPMLGKRETGDNIQRVVDLSWLITQTVTHDENVADEKGLLVCVNELS